MEDLSTITEKVKVTLNPVCVKGGLDTSQKIIEYIAKSFEYGVEHLLISTLQKDASIGNRHIDYEDLYVSPDVFDDVFFMLLSQGFKQKETVCSTGGYILKRFQKSYDCTVSFKIYISKQEFPMYWSDCVKRTFDFTMTPYGDVYQDWCRDTLVNLEELQASTEA